jgi:hypothetical protein
MPPPIYRVDRVDGVQAGRREDEILDPTVATNPRRIYTTFIQELRAGAGFSHAQSGWNHSELEFE